MGMRSERMSAVLRFGTAEKKGDGDQENFALRKGQKERTLMGKPRKHVPSLEIECYCDACRAAIADDFCSADDFNWNRAVKRLEEMLSPRFSRHGIGPIFPPTKAVLGNQK